MQTLFDVSDFTQPPKQTEKTKRKKKETFVCVFRKMGMKPGDSFFLSQLIRYMVFTKIKSENYSVFISTMHEKGVITYGEIFLGHNSLCKLITLNSYPPETDEFNYREFCLSLS